MSKLRKQSFCFPMDVEKELEVQELAVNFTVLIGEKVYIIEALSILFF